MYAGRSSAAAVAARRTHASTSLIAVLCCTFLIVLDIEHVTSMSLDKLALERNEFAEEQSAPAIVVDDMALEALPATLGDTDMYVLLPATDAESGTVNMGDQNTIEVGEAADMLMMESNVEPLSVAQPEEEQAAVVDMDNTTPIALMLAQLAETAEPLEGEKEIQPLEHNEVQEQNENVVEVDDAQIMMADHDDDATVEADEKQSTEAELVVEPVVQNTLDEVESETAPEAVDFDKKTESIDVIAVEEAKETPATVEDVEEHNVTEAVNELQSEDNDVMDTVMQEVVDSVKEVIEEEEKEQTAVEDANLEIEASADNEAIILDETKNMENVAETEVEEVAPLNTEAQIANDDAQETEEKVDEIAKIEEEVPAVAEIQMENQKETQAADMEALVTEDKEMEVKPLETELEELTVADAPENKLQDEVKDEGQEEMQEEIKEEVKEEIKEEVQEEVKEVNEEIKEDNEEIKEDNEEIKEDKQEIKEDNEEIKDELKEEELKDVVQEAVLNEDKQNEEQNKEVLNDFEEEIVKEDVKVTEINDEKVKEEDDVQIKEDVLNEEIKTEVAEEQVNEEQIQEQEVHEEKIEEELMQVEPMKNEQQQDSVQKEEMIEKVQYDPVELEIMQEEPVEEEKEQDASMEVESIQEEKVHDVPVEVESMQEEHVQEENVQVVPVEVELMQEEQVPEDKVVEVPVQEESVDVEKMQEEQAQAQEQKVQEEQTQDDLVMKDEVFTDNEKEQSTDELVEQIIENVQEEKQEDIILNDESKEQLTLASDEVTAVALDDATIQPQEVETSMNSEQTIESHDEQQNSEIIVHEIQAQPEPFMTEETQEAEESTTAPITSVNDNELLTAVQEEPIKPTEINVETEVESDQQQTTAIPAILMDDVKDVDTAQTIIEEPQMTEVNSMLTTIVQVPQQTTLDNMQIIQDDDEVAEEIPTMVENLAVPPALAVAAESVVVLPAIIQMPAQAQESAIETSTQKPLNVMDSVLNYVNASLMNSNKQDEMFSSKLRRYDGAQVWRIVVQTDKDKKLADELQTKYDGQLWKEVKAEVDYLLKPQVLAAAERHIRSANLSRIVLIDNLQKVIEVENPTPEEIAQLQNRKGHRLTWQAYHRLDDIHGFFDYLANTYPDICTVETIGYSIQKRPLKILKISNGKAGNPGVWMDGGMHAREWISPASVTYIANQLAEGWDDLPAYMQNVNWYIHAVANPDGYEYSHTTDRLWRKNMRSHGRQCPGVDLNRNFGYKWGGKGTSANPCAQTYRGSKAFSEPETFYISKFISNFPRETFQAYLSFHSYGQYILYPWGYDYQLTKDRADLDRVARQAGTTITKSSGVKYTVGSSATTLYPAAGGSDDWAKGIAGIKYAYTIEMGDTGRYGFVLPASMIESNAKDAYSFAETVARAITKTDKESRKRAF